MSVLMIVFNDLENFLIAETSIRLPGTESVSAAKSLSKIVASLVAALG